MVLELSAKRKKVLAYLLLSLLYFETVIPSYALAVSRAPIYPVAMPRKEEKASGMLIAPVNNKKTATASTAHAATGKNAFIGGPTQPEMQAFASVNSGNMVDLFSGNFSYSIPLLDVGGYPIAIGYNSGISMDQEASWVGLGWNVNPGTITRNMRGLPDDFNGAADTIQKVAAVKPNKTIGGAVGLDIELLGFPLKNKIVDSIGFSVGGSVGLFYNSYRGLGMETNVNASINAGGASMGDLSGGLAFSNNSQEGASLRPSLSYSLSKFNAQKTGGFGGNVTIGTTYSSRSGLKALQLSAGVRQYKVDEQNQKVYSQRMDVIPSAAISFAYPSYLPEINLPYTSRSISVTAKTGSLKTVLHPNIYINGYASEQVIKPEDQRMALPAYGYLNYQHAGSNTSVLLDFNRERDNPYREKPEVPNIGVPSYTYDVFSMTGEGTGGMFRAYRSDIGYVFDHSMRTKDQSGNASLDFGAGDLIHMGADLNYNRSTTTTGPWLDQSPMATNVAFTKSDKLYEAAYFRNPGEMTVNDKAFYENIGGDDVVAVNLEQAGTSSADIRTTNQLNVYRNQRYVGKKTVNPKNMTRSARDKRSQVISYLTAEEADNAGLSKYIENYTENTYTLNNCAQAFPNNELHGLEGRYYAGGWFERYLFTRVDSQIAFSYKDLFSENIPPNGGVGKFDHHFSVKWKGRLKVPVTGQYTFYTNSDDCVRFSLNDTMLIEEWKDPRPSYDSVKVNLVAGQRCDLEIEYRQTVVGAYATLEWRYGGLPTHIVPTEYLYQPQKQDTFTVAGGGLSRETRVNEFRKKSHISEIDVLNKDGRRYIYGIPVYNLSQKEVTFSVDRPSTVDSMGLVRYEKGVDNTVNNKKGLDNYFSSEKIPAYAHSFLLTGILSPDYQDLTGDGISADDPGDAIKFNYTKTAGLKNPYSWRVPASPDNNAVANYSEGLKTDNRDDKGHYVYGEKELWYLHSIESKNMIAIFKLEKRDDMPMVDEDGIRLQDDRTRKLTEISLYAKADFQAHGMNARPIKTVHFKYNNTLCTGANGRINAKGKLTLEKIWFTYNGNEKVEKNPYIFRYHQNNPAYNPAANDRWGSYKSAMHNPGAVVGNVLLNADYPYALQDSAQAANNAAAWSLSGITLPSGGRMEISYESDDYAYVQNKRAAQLYNIAGFSAGVPSKLNDLSADLYGVIDYMYVSINVPYAVSSNQELYNRYLQDMDKLYFKMAVQMPGDKFGKGREYVSCYATLDPGNYGFFNDGKTIWVRMKAIDPSAKMNTPRSVYSPLAESALQFLRLNLASKAYPGSDAGDDMGIVDAVKMLLAQADNLNNMLLTFDVAARTKHWARNVDLSRSYVRLNNPYYKKYGGGLRVKKIMVYDNWNKMTGQRESVYGQEYQYTTTKDINGKKEVISSGVAAYEPIIGGEENPWKTPVEYNMQVSTIMPVDRGYTELPYGEGFFPSPSVGYSKVRTRTIRAEKTRSANGYEEACFYTAYDFPTLTDVTNLGDSKKRFRPLLMNLLKINAKSFLGLSQGFKIELNDMNGKIKSQASYAETDPEKPISYTEYFYKVDNERALNKHLNDTVNVIASNGKISKASIGKDVELMLDMREQHSITNGYSANLNGEMFKFVWPPVMFIPILFNLIQREETLYRSVAATKVVNRHGILDSVMVIDKGSRVTTRNLLYDAETGDPLLTSTQNEYNDPVYSFSYPVSWAYDNMGGAYRNIGMTVENVTIKDGRIESGLTGNMSDYFAAGDEILVYSHPKTGGTICEPQIALFPANTFMYAVDANALTGGTPDIYFVDKNGAPFTGNKVSLKIVRSGRKNIAGSVGSIIMLTNPIDGDTLRFDNSRRVLSASAVSYNQFWKVSDRKKQAQSVTCVTIPYNEYVGPGGDCGIRYYGNQVKSKSFRKNDCAGGTGSLVVYQIPANRYSSLISIEDANAKATAALDSFGQAYANVNGTCSYTYRNRLDSVTILYHSCQGDAIPLPYVYRVAANTFSSTISQEVADSMARKRLLDSAQVNADRNGRCYYKNDTTGILAYPVCDTGGISRGIWVQVPAGVDTSMISKEAANAKARDKYRIYAQEMASLQGGCTYIYRNIAMDTTVIKNNCTTGVGEAYTYHVPAGKYQSFTSQFGANLFAHNDMRDSAQYYANLNGTCQVGIYAVLSIEPTGGDGVQSYAFLRLHFYSDAALTTPVSVTNLSVNIGGLRYWCYNNDIDDLSYTTVCNGTVQTLGKPIISINGQSGSVCYNVFYSLKNGEGYVNAGTIGGVD